MPPRRCRPEPKLFRMVEHLAITLKEEPLFHSLKSSPMRGTPTVPKL